MQIFLLDVFYATLEDETLQLFVNAEHDVSLIYVDMPYLPVATIAESVDAVNEYTQRDIQGITAHGLVGVASVTIEVNNLIVGSQWSSLGFAIVLTLLVLAVQFRDPRYALWTTSPVIATVALQWLVMASTGASLSLVTVMIGSILVGIGVDFSIHIANRIKELGGGIEAIRQATVSTGMSLFEAALVTTAGLGCGVPDTDYGDQALPRGDPDHALDRRSERLDPPASDLHVPGTCWVGDRSCNLILLPASGGPLQHPRDGFEG